MTTGTASSTKSEPKKKGNRYPWAAWFQGGKKHTFTLRRGKEYPADVADVWMMQSIRRRARHMGIRVSLSIRVDEIEVRVLGKRPVCPDPRLKPKKKSPTKPSRSRT